MSHTKLFRVSVMLFAVIATSSGTAQITGSGTPNYITKFTGTTVVGNSVLYESGGFVGIGTTSPSENLHIYTTVGDPGIIIQRAGGTNNPNYGLYVNEAGGYFSIGRVGVSDSDFVLKSGKVGIGTTSPASTLQVAGTVHSTTGGFKFPDGSVQTTAGGWQDDGSTVRLATTTDNVGIGTTAASKKLHVYENVSGYSEIMRIQNANASGQPYMVIGGASVDHGINMGYKNSGNFGWISHTGLDPAGNGAGIIINSSGNIGIGTTSPSKKLTVRGNILVERSNGTACLELGDGLDYAEGFNLSYSTRPEAGTVLVIDSENPGQLTVSTTAYDTRVAGIAAGAKGVGSGVRLGVGQFDCDVALAGRVYCNVDAADGAIQPGDLLTTSSLPGYAMKANDHSRAQGAILGKAMQGLEKGKKSQILVLVTLQ